MLRTRSVAPILKASSNTHARRQYSSSKTDPLSVAVLNQLKEIKEAGTYKSERVIISKQAANIQVTGGQEVLNFCANNYLGLSDNARVIDAAKKTLDSHGFGMSSVRFICGTQDIHKELEKKLSEFHGTEDTILYGSAFDANAGIFEALLSPEDAVLSDALNHASIIDGVRLCKAKKFRYNHNDLQDLEAKLQEASSTRARLIVTDGVFSMDGEIAPLDRIAALAKQYNASLLVDECHATGFLGATGRGTPEHHNCASGVTLINSTLGKALGGATGGYTTGPRHVIDLLRQKSRPYLFSNTVAPAVVGASLEVLRLLNESTALLDQLVSNTKLFRSSMAEAGFKLKGETHPIVPVMLGDARLAAEFADELLKKGIYVIGFSFPVVPKGEARIRVQLSAAHSTEQVKRAIDAFIAVGKAKKVIA